MKKFFVLFGIPAASIQDWMANISEEDRATQMKDMMQAWQEWMDAHKDSILDAGLPLGKTKRVDATGITDIKNDLNWFLLVQAESHEAAAEMFVGHPHLVQIPTAYAEIMDANRAGM